MKLKTKDITLDDIKAEASEPKGAKDESPEDWQIDNWAKTLLDAENIRKDESKMKHVRPHLEKQSKAIRSIADLRKRAKDLNNGN